MTRISTHRQHAKFATARRGRQAEPSVLPSIWWLVAIAVCLVALAAMPFVAVLGAYAYFQVFERIVPGVYVGETRLGGLTMYQAAVQLQRDWNMEQRLIAGVVTPDGLKTWELSPAQVGLSIDTLRTAQEAYGVGHGRDFSREMGQMLLSIQNGWEISPQVQFDRTAARAGLEVLAEQVSVPAREAALAMEGSTPVALPSAPGYRLDVDQALAYIEADPREVMVQGRLPLAVVEVAPRIPDATAAAAEAERLLSGAVEVRAYDPVRDEHFHWPVERETLASWLLVENSADGPRIALDQARVGAFLASVSDSLGAERYIDVEKFAPALSEAAGQGAPLAVTINYRARAYTVEPGDSLIAISWRVGIPTWKIIQANPGLEADNLRSGQELVIPPKDAMLALPPVENKRIAISISEQRLWTYEDGELLAEHMISTGMDRSPTQPGLFQVQTHELSAYASVWDLTMPHFIGIYEAWPGFMNGIHGLPTLSSGRVLWGNVLGRPASYGCIIMDLKPAEDLFNWADAGVIVEIMP